MKVKLDDIIRALEFVNSGMDNTDYFNSDTKEIIYQKYITKKYLSR